MSAPTGMSRLEKLYGMLESVRARELGLASHAVEEVARARQRSRAGRLFDEAQGRAGLAVDSWTESAAAVAVRSAAKVEDCLLRNIEDQRGVELAAARKVYRDCATGLKQIETLLERAREDASEIDDRAVQRSADDRYASRRAWKRMSRKQHP